ncbi:MAG: nucleotide exchange factor GrpE [Candidatus Omnitrophota bacterium]
MDRKKETKKSHPEVKLLSDEFEELKKKSAERDEYYNKWLLVHAEYENTRKRLEKEKSEHKKFANEDIISQLFPIVDNFDMALASMENAKNREAVMDGIKLVQKEFHRILEDNGVKKIETEGKQFDPSIHGAVLAVPAPDKENGAVLEEVRTGYMLNDRLLRPAQVKVVKNDGEVNSER